MVKEVRRIDFDDFAADMPALFETMALQDEVLVIEKEGKLFRIERTQESEQIPPRPDPAAFREMLRETAGALKGIDKKAFMKELRAGRQQDSKGRPA